MSLGARRLAMCLAMCRVMGCAVHATVTTGSGLTRAALLVWACCHPVQAAVPALQRQQVHHPLQALAGVPPVAERLVEPAISTHNPSATSWQIDWSHMNVYLNSHSASERLLLDAESSRLALRVGRDLDRCWRLEAGTSVLSHSGGVFDRAIDDWHDFFGLPDGGRPQAPYHGFGLQYERDGVSVARVAKPESGLSDSFVAAQYRSGCHSAGTLWRIGAWLPTGERESLLGADKASVFADMQSPQWRQDRWSVALAGGLRWRDVNGDALPFKTWLAYGTGGLNWQWTPTFGLRVQVDAHTAPFNSELVELGQPAVQLTTGGHYRSRRLGTWALSITEDIAIDTAPDIVLRLGVTLPLNQ